MISVFFSAQGVRHRDASLTQPLFFFAPVPRLAAVLFRQAQGVRHRGTHGRDRQARALPRSPPLLRTH